MPAQTVVTKNNKSHTGLIIGLVIGAVVLLCCCAGFFIFLVLIPSQTTTSTNPPVTRNINFTDTFDSNSYGWAEGASTNSLGSVARTINSGKYVWVASAKTAEPITAIANPTIERSQSLTASVEITQTSGKEAANFMLFSYYNDENNYYSFKVNQYYQQYTVGVVKNGAWTDLLPWKRDAVVNWEAANNLRVESGNGQQIFYINNTEVFRSSDTTFTSGGVAIGVQLRGKDQTAVWTFDNFSFQKIQ